MAFVFFRTALFQFFFCGAYDIVLYQWIRVYCIACGKRTRVKYFKIMFIFVQILVFMIQVSGAFLLCSYEAIPSFVGSALRVVGAGLGMMCNSIAFSIYGLKIAYTLKRGRASSVDPEKDEHLRKITLQTTALALSGVLAAFEYFFF